MDPNQGTLVAMPRDWRRIDTQALPALTPAAERLLEAFKQRSRAQAWDDGIRGEATRALHLLLAWLGAAAPIPEADIRSIPTARRWTSSRRVVASIRGGSGGGGPDVGEHAAAVTAREGPYEP